MSEHEQADVTRALQALEVKAAVLCLAVPDVCGTCGKPATCLSVDAEDDDEQQYRCDSCCGHELPLCEELVTRDQKLANLATAFGMVSECIQRLVPEHDEAGEHFEELALDCNRALYPAPDPAPTRKPAKAQTQRQLFEER